MSSRRSRSSTHQDQEWLPPTPAPPSLWSPLQGLGSVWGGLGETYIPVSGGEMTVGAYIGVGVEQVSTEVTERVAGGGADCERS